MQQHENLESIQSAFRALADPTRRDILTKLTEKDMTIGEIATHYPVTRAAVKKHLTILEEGKLITVQISGRERINHLQPMALKSANDWFNQFSQFWDTRLAALKNAVETDNQSNTPQKKDT